MARRKVVCLIACLVLAVSVGVRIYQVNSEVKTIEVEHYGMGEWVDLNGAFLNTYHENTDGYSVKVKSAQVTSYNEYIARYGLHKDRTIDGLDESSIINVEFEIKNTGNDEGAFLIFECKLIPIRKNSYYIPSLSLWQESEEEVDERSFAVSIRRDSHYTTFVPYKVNKFDKEDYTEFRNPIHDKSFELVVSNSPVRKVIDVTLTP